MTTKCIYIMMSKRKITMIITIASQKGGVGKSTISINMALGMAGLKSKYKVALVDADEQRSCIETLQPHNGRENLKLYEAAEKPHRLIEKITAKHQIIFIDTPPHSHEVMYQAAAVSQLVIIPLQPSPLDIRGVSRTVKAIEVIKGKHNPDLQCRFLINRITPRTILANEIRAALVKYYPYPTLDAVLHNREAYKQSLITGLSVIEYDKNSQAAAEMNKLLIEIVNIVSTSKH